MSTTDSIDRGIDEQIAEFNKQCAAAQAEWDALPEAEKARRTAAAEAEEAMRLNRQAVTASAQWGHIEWPDGVDLDAVAREESHPDLAVSTCMQYTMVHDDPGGCTGELLTRGGAVFLGQVGHCALYRIPSDRMDVVREVQAMDDDQRLRRCRELGIW